MHQRPKKWPIRKSMLTCEWRHPTQEIQVISLREGKFSGRKLVKSRRDQLWVEVYPLCSYAIYLSCLITKHDSLLKFPNENCYCICILTVGTAPWGEFHKCWTLCSGWYYNFHGQVIVKQLNYTSQYWFINCKHALECKNKNSKSFTVSYPGVWQVEGK